MHEFKPVKELYFSSIMERIAAKKTFEGKKLFVDLDGTLIKVQATHAERPGERTISDYDQAHVSIEYKNKRFGFQITEINRIANSALRHAKKHGADIYITSAADDEYVRKVVRTSGLNEFVDDCFGYESMRHLIGKRWTVSPKNFSYIVDLVGEKDPAGNCVVLGNDPHSDVAYEPKGIVSIIGKMERIFSRGFLHLGVYGWLGNGHLGKGFDKAFKKYEEHGRNSNKERIFCMARTEEWQFDKRTTGFARIVFVNPELYDDTQKERG
ncbi:hypothetical protein JXA56_01445 [Candidatus Micrarchaeota archaeon]|nr:hypothetical protein [Candidatus Micrarchaeota archaeon]